MDPTPPAAVTADPLLIALPTADRRRSFDFYRHALGFEVVGEPADDGVPEPLQFVLNASTHLMFVPTGGFGWVIGEQGVHDDPSRSEVALGLAASDAAEVDAVVRRARAAGARVTAEPEAKPWGYTAAFADPDGHLWTITAAPTTG